MYGKQQQPYGLAGFSDLTVGIKLPERQQAKLTSAKINRERKRLSSQSCKHCVKCQKIECQFSLSEGKSFD